MSKPKVPTAGQCNGVIIISWRVTITGIGIAAIPFTAIYAQRVYFAIGRKQRLTLKKALQKHKDFYS
jgi:hypothetical protein